MVNVVYAFNVLYLKVQYTTSPKTQLLPKGYSTSKWLPHLTPSIRPIHSYIVSPNGYTIGYGSGGVLDTEHGRSKALRDELNGGQLFAGAARTR